MMTARQFPDLPNIARSYSIAARRAASRPAPALLAICLLAAATAFAPAETCTTQSGMAPAERDAIADAARNLAAKVQSNDATALRTASVAELAKDFGALQYLVGQTAPRLTGGVATVEQVYLLDASTLKRNPDGSAPDAEFFCSLNRSTMEAEFVIPALPPGKYAFAMVTMACPGRRGQSRPRGGCRFSCAKTLDPAQGKWLLAGFYPKPMTAAGHDGLWYWTQARQFAKDKQPWNAWLYYQAAQKLLQPADFVISTHLDKLRTEAAAAAPPALSEGVSVDAPLVVKAADGSEYHFTGLGVDDSLAQSSLDIEVHLRLELPAAPAPDSKPEAKPAATDPAAARKRNNAAASALSPPTPSCASPSTGSGSTPKRPARPLRHRAAHVRHQIVRHQASCWQPRPASTSRGPAGTTPGGAARALPAAWGAQNRRPGRAPSPASPSPGTERTFIGTVNETIPVSPWLSNPSRIASRAPSVASPCPQCSGASRQPISTHGVNAATKSGTANPRNPIKPWLSRSSAA